MRSTRGQKAFQNIAANRAEGVLHVRGSQAAYTNEGIYLEVVFFVPR